MARNLDDTDLLVPFMSGITAPKDFRLGVELEYFPVHLSDLSLVPYDSDPGMRDILYGLASQYGWSPVYEGTNVIELLRGDERITLEPGGVIPPGRQGPRGPDRHVHRRLAGAAAAEGGGVGRPIIWRC